MGVGVDTGVSVLVPPLQPATATTKKRANLGEVRCFTMYLQP